NLLKTGSAYYAPSSSAVQMAKSILKDEKRLLPCAAYVNGQYGLKDIYMGVPVILGHNGVEKIIELELSQPELDSLKGSGAEITKDLKTLREKGILRYPALARRAEVPRQRQPLSLIGRLELSSAIEHLARRHGAVEGEPEQHLPVLDEEGHVVRADLEH